MIYILNTDISEKKVVPKALENVFGVGKKILLNCVDF